MQPETVTEFLSARIAEDKQWATLNANARGAVCSDPECLIYARHRAKGQTFPPHGPHDFRAASNTGVPAGRPPLWTRRVLAECEAKRRIVELHTAYDEPQKMVYGTITACDECGSVDDSPVEWPCPTLRLLAAVYADHPDYREEWRP